MKFSLRNYINGRSVALGLASGLLFFLAFPPVALGFAAWIAAVPLLLLAATRDARGTVIPAYLGGALFFFAGLEWVRHATVFGMITLGLIMAFYFVAFALVAGPARRRLGIPLGIAAPVVWVSLELIRAYALTGFPYLLVGHSQISSLRLMQILDITGVYGVSFIVMAANGFIADMLLSRRLHGARPFAVSGMVAILSLTIALIYGHYRMPAVEAATTPGPHVLVVQPNIPQYIKNTWIDPRDELGRYQRLTFAALRELRAAEGAEALDPLVIWPETALPGPYNMDSDRWIRELRSQLGMTMQAYRISRLLTGFATRDDGGRFNSAIYILDEPNTFERYDKMHLVPFGEYVPLHNVIPFLKTLVPRESPYVPGSEYVLFEFDGHRFGTVICYEDIFPGIVRGFVNRGAEFIVNISNEGWFLDSAEADQHLEIARCRSIETRVGMVRSTNSGISCIIEPTGKVSQIIEIDGKRKMVRGHMSGRISLGPGGTFYALHGELFAILCLLGTIGITTAVIYTVKRKGFTK